jgi:hypothetical protein
MRLNLLRIDRSLSRLDQTATLHQIHIELPRSEALSDANLDASDLSERTPALSTGDFGPTLETSPSKTNLPVFQ